MTRYILWLFLFFCYALPGCNNDDNRGGPIPPPLPPPPPPTLLSTIVISDIEGIPDGVAFDRLVANISGVDWSVIATVEANYADGQATLILPTSFTAERLAKVTSDYTGDVTVRPVKRPDYSGFWPGKSSDDEAKVAGLGDIFAYDGDQRVGRVYLSGNVTEGAIVRPAFVYFHYTDRDYRLSGYHRSYIYGASFVTGWNAYANVNLQEESGVGTIRCTTDIDENADFAWKFDHQN